MPSSLTSVGAYAFQNTGLKSIEIPVGVTYLPVGIFSGSSVLESVKMLGVTSCAYSSPDYGDNMIGNNWSYTKQFWGCTSLKTVELGMAVPPGTPKNGDNSLPHYGFANLPSLESVKIGGVLELSNAYIFQDCKSLRSVILPEGLNTIGAYAFQGCENLVSLTLRDSVTSIGNNAFSDCNKLNLRLYRGTYAHTYAVANGIKWTTLEPETLTSVEWTTGTITRPHGSENSATGLDLPTKITILSVPENYPAVSPRKVSATVIWEQSAADYNPSRVDAQEFDYHGTVVLPASVKNRRGLALSGSVKIRVKAENEPSLGVGADVTLPSDAPLFGGAEFEMDMAGVDIKLKVEDDKIKVGIGLKEDVLDKDKQKWEGFKKAFENAKEKGIKSLSEAKNNKGISTIAKVPLDISVMGYIEGTFDSNRSLKGLAGKIMVEAEFKVGTEQQLIVVVVPVVVKFELSAKLGLQASLGYDWSKQEAYVDGEISFTFPKIKASAGVGIAYIADVSVYGSIQHDVKFSSSTATDGDNGLELSMTGEAGVSAHAGPFGGELVLLKGTWKYYPGTNRGGGRSRSVGVQALSDPGTYHVDTSGLSGRSAWLSGANQSGARGRMSVQSGSTAQSDIQEHIYNGARPKIVVADNGLKMMVWQDAVASRSVGNHIAVLYSISEPGSDVWSAPQIVWDDGTVDYSPAVCANGNDLYITWMNSKRNDFTAQLTMEEYAASCEIAVVKYSAQTKSFSAPDTLTNNSILDMTPQIAADGNGCDVIWIESGSNNIFENEGTSRILSAHYENGSAAQTVELDSYVGKMLTNLTAGNFGADVYAAYSFDSDADIETAEDTDLYLANVSTPGEPLVVATNRNSMWGMQFVKLGGVNRLLWEEAGSLNSLSAADSYPEPLIEDLDVGGKWTVVNGTDGDLLAYPAATDDDDKMLIQGVLFSGGSFSQPITIGESVGTIQNLAGYHDNGSWRFVYARTDATIGSSTVLESTDLVTSTATPHNALAVEDISYNEESIAPGASAVVKLTVRNTGYNDQVGYTLRVNSPDSMIYNQASNINIPVGETREIEITVPVPANAKAGDKYTVTAAPATGDSGAASFNLPQPDLQLETTESEVDGNTAIHATVTNVSGFSCGGKLVVHLDNASGTVLREYPLGTIAGKGSVNVAMSANDVADISRPGDILYLEVVSDVPETYTSDNASSVLVKGAAVRHVVTFDANGGSVSPATAQTGLDGKLTALPTPSRSGYSFAGWYTLLSGGLQITTDTLFNGDTTVYARWSSIPVENPLTGIAIKTQPKLIYLEGNTLDLNAMVATLTYRDGSSEDVPFSNFAAKGITINIAHGTNLATAHHGVRVSLSLGSLTAQTTALTVVAKPPSYGNAAASIAGAVVTAIPDALFTGAQIKPVLTVTLGSKALKPGTDYTVSYGANVAIGKGVATITGKGAYKDTKAVTFNIVPTRLSISKLTVGKKHVKVAWKAAPKAQGITKYQIRYALKGKTAWKTVNVPAKKLNVIIKKLKAGKTYQFQIRSYKTVSGMNYYALWSASKVSKKVK